jgi:hypothetical protein
VWRISALMASSFRLRSTPWMRKNRLDLLRRSFAVLGPLHSDAELLQEFWADAGFPSMASRFWERGSPSCSGERPMPPRLITPAPILGRLTFPPAPGITTSLRVVRHYRNGALRRLKVRPVNVWASRPAH